ncbi:MAG: thioesterase family protein [Polyangia bacterium]
MSRIPTAAPLTPLVEVAEVRVLYVDTDQMGVVNNVHYLRFFEVGRAEWIRARGQAYRDLEKDGLMLPVVEAHVRYRAPARYDDLLAVEAGPSAVTAASLTFSYAIYRKHDRQLLAEGWTRHASTDLSGRVRRLSEHMLKLLGLADVEDQRGTNKHG